MSSQKLKHSRPLLLRGVTSVVGAASFLILLPLLLTPPISATASRSPLVSTGLKNLGNTCYMNAQLQCAFHIPAIRQAVLEERPTPDHVLAEQSDGGSNNENTLSDSDEEDDDNGSEETTSSTQVTPEPEEPALLALRELFQNMMDNSSANQQKPVVPFSFCRRLGIPVFEQQDSQEFWKLLLPATGCEALTDFYKGSFEDYIIPLDGSGREKRREELFLDLSLDISSSREAMDSLRKTFGEPELLSVAEGNGWRPEKGADKVDAHKGSLLVSEGLPPVLQLHLKRFNYDWQFDTMTKLNSRFAFPEVLDLSTICKSSSEADIDTTLYDLQSIVVHVGEYGAGHYYAYVRPDARKDEWYRFNDDHVQEVSFKEVVEDAYGGRNAVSKSKRRTGLVGKLKRALRGRGSFGWGGSTSSAYVVQYVKRRDLPKLYLDD